MPRIFAGTRRQCCRLGRRGRRLRRGGGDAVAVNDSERIMKMHKDCRILAFLCYSILYVFYVGLSYVEWRHGRRDGNDDRNTYFIKLY